MCRSIRTLRYPDDAATTGEIAAAARQYVRKVSGFRAPSARNADAFDSAIAEIAAASERLLVAIGADVEDGPDRKPPLRGQAVARDRAHDAAHEHDHGHDTAHDHDHAHAQPHAHA